MSITLGKLVAKGITRDDAIINFRSFGNLIRGPSDTGKSHIRDCLWYLLGGEKAPKGIPENEGYDTLLLELQTSDGSEYTIRRGLAGGAAAVYPTSIAEMDSYEALAEDVGSLIVSLAGAAGILILRSMSKRGALTAGDLRHWSLISQPAMISEASTIGVPTEAPQRRASFSVFLTGKDDSAVILAATKDEKLRIKSQIESAEADLRRIFAEIPDGATSPETRDALDRVDETLGVLSSQQTQRSRQLRGLRDELAILMSTITEAERKFVYSASLVSRFELLDEKYKSDFSRLVAVSDGLAVFDALEAQPCPLCHTALQDQRSELVRDPAAVKLQRVAMAAESAKITALRTGLVAALAIEKSAKLALEVKISELNARLTVVERAEQAALVANSEEFSVDPKVLAIRRSELYSLQKSFDEQARLTAELVRLKAIIPTKNAPLARQTLSDSIVVARYAQELLHLWGLTSVETIEVDAYECDLIINGRARLSYGAGMRSIFLTAMIVALLKHSMKAGHPHLGLVVLDSPMKSYSDPKNRADVTISPKAVKDLFYLWLASWQGPGQVVVLENELISPHTAALLKPTEFTKSLDEGRYGFYPLSDGRSKP